MSVHAAIEKYFSGKTIVIATQHGKEAVLKPMLEQQLGVKVVTPSVFNSDAFGTFSGEKERNGSPLDVARKKCIAAHELTGLDIVLASEGSFGAHPVLGFVPADEELLLLKDFANNLEIKAKVLSTKTNFNGTECYHWEQVLFFASQVSFPSHALIVKSSKDDYKQMHKGITDWETLKNTFHSYKDQYGKAFIETDMRAMHNPTRMKVIGEAAEKLIGVIKQICPVCECPGYDVQKVEKGLPCGYCQTPTESAKAYIYACQRCGHTDTKLYPFKKMQEDPMYCNECNP